MKWNKSIIGEIGFIRTDYKLSYKDSIKKIPKNARIMKGWEFVKLIDENYEAFDNFPKGEDYFCYGNKDYFRWGALYVDRLDLRSRLYGYYFLGNAYYRSVGVLVVKK